MSSLSTVTSVAKRSVVAATATTGGVRLLAPNTLRQGFSVANASTAILYLGLGSTAPTSGDHTLAMAGNANGESYYETPFNYQGEVWAIWATDTGNALVTEYF